MVSDLKTAPSDHIRKKAIELPFEEFEKWKETAIILKNEKLNSLLLRYCDAPRANYEDLCKDVDSVTTAAGVMLSPESII